MQVKPKSFAFVRYLFPFTALLLTGTALFGAHAWIPQEASQRPVWDVQMQVNSQAGSNITIQNQCQQAHSFTVSSQKTPYLQLMAGATVNVPGNSTQNLPVRFNTNGMAAGQYQGAVVVKCDTCRKEKTCKQDREILPLHLVILGEGGPQMTPGNPSEPQVPGPPVVKQDAPKPKASPAKNEGPTEPAYDDDDKKTDTAFSKDVDKDKLAKCKGTCSKRGKYKADDGETWAFCPASKECKQPCECMLFVALKQGEKNPDPKDKDGEAYKLRLAGTSPGNEKTKNRPQAKTDKQHVVACRCYQL